MKTNENLKEKLDFIGLDLENIPNKLNFFQNINCRMHKNYNEKNYKVYKYIDVNDIEIYLTPTNRLTDYTEKYAKAVPIGEYLQTDSEENIERNIEFLNLIKNLQIEELENLENQQLQFSQSIPYKVNFRKDYLWQIHYSETTNKYFMLVPIKESECTALFYVIKKQIENKSKKIYVPICYSNYNNQILNNEELEEIEKYLCFFTKEWPLIYEVYDKDENMSLQIFGKTNIYDSVKSEYKIELHEAEKIESFYKLLKALFILETQLSHHYKFDVKIDRKGIPNFEFKKDELNYEKLIPFIKKEYVKGLEKIIKAKELKINYEKELKKLKELCSSLDNEYYDKEKQISTFLECKKTFLGRVKYFIKYKKQKIEIQEQKIIEKEETTKLKYCERTEIKDTYTIEELLNLYTNFDKEENTIKDLQLDIEAMNKRIEILQAKIKNATQYIREIDEHKKSIFEFWKFTNKDEAKQLNEGTVENYKNKKLKKTFNYELDFENLAKQLDKTQRELFTKEETDNIFLATTNIFKDINIIANNKVITEENLENAKKGIGSDEEKKVSFDVFGSITTTREQTHVLGNVKHRENEKNKFAILELKQDTNLLEYNEKIRQVCMNIEQSMEKFRNPFDIPIYKTGELNDGFNIFYINPDNALKNVNENETNLYKIVLKENTNCLALTNIIFYNNTNQTLPLGMNVLDGIMIDTKKLNLKLKEENQNYIIKAIGDRPKPEALKINIFEYEIC